ncbi:MAG: signal peptidase II [Gemmatimonas sp.]
MTAPLASIDKDLQALEQKRVANETMVRYLMVAAGAGLIDWLTKAMAVHFLSDATHMLADRFALMLVFNKGAAGGVTLGPGTWLLNVCVTAFSVLVISLVVRPLAAVDRRASVALGLVAGGAMGNLMSMVAGPEGVADFLAFRIGENAVVANVADFALWIGAVLLVPVVRTLIRAIRAERKAKEARGIRYIEA